MTAEIHDFRQREATRALPPPHNIEAEQALLGAILINNEAYGSVAGFLRSEHFFEEVHRRIFDVASQLIRGGKVATPITLKTFLGDADLGGITIPQYLARLAAEATAIVNTEDYGRNVYDLAARRDLVGIGERLAKMAQDQPVSMTCADVATASLEELHVIAATTPANPSRPVSAFADDLMNEVEGVLSGLITPRLVTTGYSDLDKAMNGYEPGTLVIAAGRPGMGKTVLANSTGCRCARSGVGVLEFPLEIGPSQMVARHLADLAFRGVGSSPAFRDIGKRAREMPEDQVQAVREAHTRLRQLPIVIDGRSRVTVAQIAAKVAQVERDMRTRGIELGLVILDHLDFIAASDRYRGIRVQEIGEIVLGLKDIARSQGVCILLMSQLSREVEKRPANERRPTLADLRNSGDLEQVADVVMFLYREEYYLTRSAEYLAGDPAAFDAALAARGKLELVLAKVRAGPTPTIHLWCDVASSSISSYQRGGA